MTWATERLEALKTKDTKLAPVAETLRLGGIDGWSEGRVHKRWVPTEDVLNSDGSMFGGHIAALADQMLAFAMSVISDDKAFRTINLGVQFFKVGRGHALHVEARVVMMSKSLISVAAEFRDDNGELIANASAQQMIVSFPETSRVPKS